MHDDQTTRPDDSACGPQAREAINRLIDVVMDGLRYGHFRCAITSAIGKNNKRDLVIEAGKSHKFTPYRRTTCRVDGAKTGDPWDGDAEHANDDTIQRYRWESEAGDQRRGAA